MFDPICCARLECSVSHAVLRFICWSREEHKQDSSFRNQIMAAEEPLQRTAPWVWGSFDGSINKTKPNKKTKHLNSVMTSMMNNSLQGNVY